MAKFKVGDTIYNPDSKLPGDPIHITIAYIGKTSYRFQYGNWLPINLVDAYWELVSDEGEIEE